MKYTLITDNICNFPATEDLAHRIRRHAVRMTHFGKSSHIGAVLSIADILAVLYGRILRVKPTDPDWIDRDRFILSKGHGCAGVYAVLAEIGFFPVEELKNHTANGSGFAGHISHKGIPGVEISTGSLGHGLSIGVGMAYAANLDGRRHRVYVLLSDGECDEGSNWEAILFAAHHKLSNLVAMVDYNKLQSLKSVAETLALEPFAEKWRAFGWEVQEVDGHDHDALTAVLAAPQRKDAKPLCVIAHTIKGKGVTFMENSVLWHYRIPQGEEYVQAMKELGEEVDAE